MGKTSFGGFFFFFDREYYHIFFVLVYLFLDFLQNLKKWMKKIDEIRELVSVSELPIWETLKERQQK